MSPTRKLFLFVALPLVVAFIGVGSYLASGKKDQAKSVANQEEGMTQLPTQTDEKTNPESADVRWENTSEGGWLALSTAPSCPEPFALKSPTDLSKATSILPPGQERRGTFEGQGGNYKPHGAFRFDGLKNNEVQVVAPISGYVYRGSRYLIGGEIQYGFDLIHPCGYMIRLGHLRTLSPTFQAYADKFPAAKELDSRTERIEGLPAIKAGDLIGTAVGLPQNDNTFFDLGVFDLRKPNESSKNAAYAAAHADSKELTSYAVCWYDLLPKIDADRIKALPAGDPVSGKTSDYCK